MNILTIGFQELWNDFILSFKGILITESRKQDISFTFVKLSLSDVISTWFSEYTINGRWLYGLIQDEPDKGLLVKEILQKDINLVEIKHNNIHNSVKYLIPIGAGAVGYGVAQAAHLNLWGTLCASLIPMAIAYPMTARIFSNKREQVQEKVINDYISQLEKYKESIMSVLLA